MSSIPAKKSARHFWVASGPFLETYLIFLAPPSCPGGVSHAEGVSGQLHFFDADGTLVNETNLSLEPGRPSTLEVGQFLGSCKLESGIRHSHCIVNFPSAPSFVSPWIVCRILSKTGATIVGEPDLVSNERNSFAPVVFSPVRRPLLCVINQEEEEIKLRCQLFLGSRVPEAELTVSPLGARLLSLDVEFENSLPQEPGKTVRAYMRLGMKGGGVAGVQLLEAYAGARNEQFVSAVG